MGDLFKRISEEGNKVTIQNVETGEIEVIDKSQIVSDESEYIGVANAKMMLAQEEDEENED